MSLLCQKDMPLAQVGRGDSPLLPLPHWVLGKQAGKCMSVSKDEPDAGIMEAATHLQESEWHLGNSQLTASVPTCRRSPWVVQYAPHVTLPCRIQCKSMMAPIAWSKSETRRETCHAQIRVRHSGGDSRHHVDIQMCLEKLPRTSTSCVPYHLSLPRT